MLRSGFFLLTFYPFTGLCAVLSLLVRILGGEKRQHRFHRVWAWGCLRLAGVRLIVEGQEHLPADRPVIYMSNHQGNFDIPVLFAGLPGQFRWLAKASLFRIPLFGQAMRLAGYIPVERDDRRKAMESVIEAAQRVAAGTSVMIFPEGTRSPDGRLLPFKKGGFVLAMHAQVAIVPIAIDGSAAVMPKYSLLLRGREIRMRIFPPLTPHGKGAQEREALMNEVARLIASALTPQTSPSD